MTTSTSQTMALSLWLMTMSPMIMASFLCTYSVFFACLLGSYGVFVTVTSLNYGEFLGRARQCLQDILSLPMVVHVWIVAELLLPEYSAVIWWLYEVYFTLTTIFSFVKECVARFKTLGWKGKLLLLFVLLAIIVPFAEAARTTRRRRYRVGMNPNSNAGIMQWNANYAYNHSTFGRDFYKLIAMVIQNIPVPGLHPSVSIVLRSLYNGVAFVVMSNPGEVARFLGVFVPPNKKKTRIAYFYDLMRAWGCIFHCLSDGFFRTTNEIITNAASKWRFRVSTDVLNAARQRVLTELNFRTLLESAIGNIRAPSGRLQDNIRHDHSPFIVFVINGSSYPSIGQARGQLTGDTTLKTAFLTDLKQELVDSFYSNPKSFVTTEQSYSPNNLSVSDTFPATARGEETEVVVKFNRGFTQDDFRG